MKELAYISTPRDLVFDDDILSIMQDSRRNNARLGVTGLLSYDGKSFFQILEGGTHVVNRLFGHIQADPRHTEVRVLAEGPIEARAFPGWSMEYRLVDPRLSRLGLMSARAGKGLVRTGTLGACAARVFKS